MTDFYWHLHHDVIVEPAIMPIEDRIAYIKKYKPGHEQEPRLRLLNKVQGKLPDEVIKAGEAYHKAGKAYKKILKTHDTTQEAYNKALRTYLRATKAYFEALENHREEIEALHAKECSDCPWDGHTIFSRRQK